MYRLALTPRAAKFLEGLPAKQFRQVTLKIFALLRDPFPPDSARLSGYPYYRADVGEYRIIYRIDEGTVKVPLVGKRNDDEVYRDLNRLM